MNFANILQTNFIITWDVVTISFIFFAAFLYAFRVSRKNLLYFAVSIYFSSVLLFLFPYFDDLNIGVNNEFIKVAVFAVFIILLYYIFSGGFIHLALPIPKRGEGPYWQKVLLSLSLAGFLISIVFTQFYRILDKDVSKFIASGFLNETSLFIWAVVPILVILIFRKSN